MHERPTLYIHNNWGGLYHIQKHNDVEGEVLVDVISKPKTWPLMLLSGWQERQWMSINDMIYFRKETD